MKITDEQFYEGMEIPFLYVRAYKNWLMRHTVFYPIGIAHIVRLILFIYRKLIPYSETVADKIASAGYIKGRNDGYDHGYHKGLREGKDAMIRGLKTYQIMPDEQREDCWMESRRDASDA